MGQSNPIEPPDVEQRRKQYRSPTQRTYRLSELADDRRSYSPGKWLSIGQDEVSWGEYRRARSELEATRQFGHVAP